MTELGGGELLECEWCGASFERPHRYGPRPRTCSVKHRRALAAARRSLGDPVIAGVMRQVAASPQFVAVMEQVTSSAARTIRELKLLPGDAGPGMLVGQGVLAEELKKLKLPGASALSVSIAAMGEELGRVIPGGTTGLLSRFVGRYPGELQELLASMTPGFRFNDYVTWMTKLPRIDTPIWADALRREGGALTEVLRSIAPEVDDALEQVYEEWLAVTRAADVETSGEPGLPSVMLLVAIVLQLAVVLGERAPIAGAVLWGWLGAIDGTVGRVAIAHGVISAAHRRSGAGDEPETGERA